MHKGLVDKGLIFFDMGNTLLDYHTGPSDEEKDLMGIHRMHALIEDEKITIALLKQKFLKGINDFHESRLRTLEESDVLPLLDFISEDRAFKMRLLYAFYSPYKEHIHVNSGAEEVLKTLKAAGYQICVISNCYLPGEIYEDIFDYCGLSQYIDAFFFSYEHGKRKPKKEIFTWAVEAVQMPIEACVMIGDGFKADIMGAANIQMESIWYNPHQRPAMCKTPLMIDSIGDFHELLAN